MILSTNPHCILAVLCKWKLPPCEAGLEPHTWAQDGQAVIVTNTFYRFLLGFFFQTFPNVIFFFSVECVQVSVGRHLNIRKPGFLDFSTAILSALQHSFNSPFLFALLFSWDESRMLIELTGELLGEFLLLLKCYLPVSYFHGVLWPVSYSVQLKLISCPSSFQCLQLQKLLSPI